MCHAACSCGTFFAQAKTIPLAPPSSPPLLLRVSGPFTSWPVILHVLARGSFSGICPLASSPPFPNYTTSVLYVSLSSRLPFTALSIVMVIVRDLCRYWIDICLSRWTLDSMRTSPSLSWSPFSIPTTLPTTIPTTVFPSGTPC